MRRRLVWLALAAFCGAAAADTDVRVYIGSASTRDSALTIRQGATDSNARFDPVGFDSRSFENPVYYGLRATHRFESMPSWGAGVDFVHYKAYAKLDRTVTARGTWNGVPMDATAPLATWVRQLSMSHGVNTIGPMIEYRWPASGRWELYGGGGPIWFVNHPESTINGMSLEKYQASGWGWQVLGGVTFRVTERWLVFGEVKFSSGRARHDVAGAGRFEVDLRTTHSVIGVGYRFD